MLRQKKNLSAIFNKKCAPRECAFVKVTAINSCAAAFDI